MASFKCSSFVSPFVLNSQWEPLNNGKGEARTSRRLKPKFELKRMEKESSITKCYQIIDAERVAAPVNPIKYQNKYYTVSPIKNKKLKHKRNW